MTESKRPSVRWVRLAGLTTVQVNEDERGWVGYAQSVHYTPDNEFSKGFATFQKCIKNGYTVEPLAIL